jgi:hypothetical protein
MANLSNINNKFLVTTGGNVLIGQTAVVGTSVLQAEGGTNAIIRMNSTSGTGGRMDFAHSGSNYGNVGSARNMLGVGNATDMMVNGDSILYLGVGAQHMTILSSGKVGIGETSPDSTLTVGGNFTATTTKPTVSVSNTTSGGSLGIRGLSPILAFDKTAGGVPKILMDGGGLEFKNGTLDAQGDVHLKIDSDGNVGIGTDSPVTKLELKGLIAGSVTNDRETTTSSFVINGITENMSLQFGLGGSALNYGNWIQSGYDNGVPTAASLYLNPIGGNVGIGTTTPNPFGWGNKHLTLTTTGINQYVALDLIGTGNAAGAILFGGGSGSGSGTSIGRAQISALDGSNLVFATNGSNSGASFNERMRIDSSGNINIGTGAASDTYVRIYNASSGDITAGYQVYNGSNLDLNIYTNPLFGNSTFFSRETFSFNTSDGAKVKILNNGNVGIGTVAEFPLTITKNTTSGLNSGVMLSFNGVGAYSTGYRFLSEANGSAQYLQVLFDGDALKWKQWNGSSYAEKMVLYDGGRLHPTGGVFLGSSNNSNLLDDYEEGTWDPQIAMSASTISVSYSYKLGTYTKIGRMVMAMFDLNATVSGTISGFASVNGLPFTVGSSVAGGGGMAGYSAAQWRSSSLFNAGGANQQIKGFPNQNTTYIYCQLDDSGTTGFSGGAGASWKTGVAGRVTGYTMYFVN